MQNKNLKPIFFEFSGYKFKPREKILKFEYKIGFVGQKPLVFVEKIIFPHIQKTKLFVFASPEVSGDEAIYG